MVAVTITKATFFVSFSSTSPADPDLPVGMSMMLITLARLRMVGR